MLRVVGISIQSSAVAISSYEPGIERAFEMKYILTDLEALDIRDHAEKRPQAPDMVGPLRGSYLGAILPTDNMD